MSLPMVQPCRRAGMPPMVAVMLASLAAVGLLVAAFVRLGQGPSSGTSSRPLTLYCAAGIKPVVEEIVERYARESGVRIDVQYGGSGTLLGQMEVNPHGDLYLAADDSYVVKGRELGLLREVIPVATQHPVIAVRRGNPRGIGGVADLLRDDVTFGLANPDAAAVGRVARAALERSGVWGDLERRCKVFKPTVNDLATDIKLGAVDAGIIWDCTAAQVEGLEAVEVEELARETRAIEIAVLAASEQPTEAIRFARYLAARDRGGEVFDRLGYGALARDVWARRPAVLLYAGSMFNAAIDETVQAFERREGVEVDRVYNGCGILVAQMRAGGSPDAYFSCDDSFMDAVDDRFTGRLEVSENPMVIAVARGNPRGISSLEDLLGEGVRVGLAHPEKSALGHLTRRLLEREALLTGLEASGNWKLDAPQGDFLVNELQTGALDAAIVYASNAHAARERVDTVPIASPLAVARQPFAVAKQTDHARTVGRLLDACLAAESRGRFESMGFTWVLGEGE